MKHLQAHIVDYLYEEYISKEFPAECSSERIVSQDRMTIRRRKT
ncbi:MAG: hypothetical protein OEM18_02175 [Nitrosopumilus sp.]|nr:hypothetical protein [Nitrosopumilus sp.]